MAIPTKTDLRRDYSAQRKALAPDVKAGAERAIYERLFASPVWKGAGTVMSYVSFGAEVGTRPILERAMAEDKRLVVPLIAPTLDMTPISQLRSLQHLVAGRIAGILEPAASYRQDVPPSEVDLVLVPGVAFDRAGGRLGLGGGYYDRLLPKMRKAVRIGIAFSVQVSIERLPALEHDVPMHAILTEEEFIEVTNPTADSGPGGS